MQGNQNSFFRRNERQSIECSDWDGSGRYTVTIRDQISDSFFMSQKVNQGTVSPTNFNVIFDRTGLAANVHQMFAYSLTHLYYNWTVMNWNCNTITWSLINCNFDIDIYFWWIGKVLGPHMLRIVLEFVEFLTPKFGLHKLRIFQEFGRIFFF